MREALQPGLTVTELTDRALIALQGPAAEAALAQLDPSVTDTRFMDVFDLTLLGHTVWVSRSGYTGEDGFELSVPAEAAREIWQALSSNDTVEPIGLGARDSLRLEAGLCLYGHDIDATTTPLEADLGWAIQKSRRLSGIREGGFPGASKVLAQYGDESIRKRIGLQPEGRAPMREGVLLFGDADSADPIGQVTSGGFGPSVQTPIAMGYVDAEFATIGQQVFGEVRGKRLPVTVSALPFSPHGFKR